MKLGTKVKKNPETWEVTEFDEWGRGEDYGIVIESPFELDEGEVDVRWYIGKTKVGRCFEFVKHLLKIG